MEAVAAVVASTFQKGGVTFDAGGAVALPPWGPGKSRLRGTESSKSRMSKVEATTMVEEASRLAPGSYRIAVKRARAGRGLFALEPIPKGACIIEYVGPTLQEEEWLHSWNRYLFKVTKKTTINGWNKKNTARFINHSCRPNCEIKIRRGRVFIMAKRAIKIGEELAYHYGKEYFDDVIRPMGCMCPKCSS